MHELGDLQIPNAEPFTENLIPTVVGDELVAAFRAENMQWAKAVLALKPSDERATIDQGYMARGIGTQLAWRASHDKPNGSHNSEEPQVSGEEASPISDDLVSHAPHAAPNGHHNGEAAHGLREEGLFRRLGGSFMRALANRNDA